MVFLACAMKLFFGTLGQVAVKSLTGNIPKARGIQWQFTWAALLTITHGAVVGELRMDWTTAWIAAVGCMNALGCLCEWHAYEHSLSKTALMLPLIPIWATILVVLILGEDTLWGNATLLAGIVLLHGAALLLPWQRGGRERWNWRWLGWTGGCIAICAVAVLLIKVASLSTPPGQFVAAWYGGSLLGAIGIAHVRREPHLSLRQTVRTVPITIGIVGAMVALYWLLRLTDASIALALMSFLTPIPTMILGWFVFGERKKFNLLQVLGCVAGIAGCACIAISMMA